MIPNWPLPRLAFPLFFTPLLLYLHSGRQKDRATFRSLRCIVFMSTLNTIPCTAAWMNSSSWTLWNSPQKRPRPPVTVQFHYSSNRFFLSFPPPDVSSYRQLQVEQGVPNILFYAMKFNLDFTKACKASILAGGDSGNVLPLPLFFSCMCALLHFIRP